MLLNALTKIIFSTITAKYKTKARKPVKAKGLGGINGKKKGSASSSLNSSPNKYSSGSQSSGESDLDSISEQDSPASCSDFDVHQDGDYDSADSRNEHSSQVQLQKVLASLDLTAVSSLCLALLNKAYINEYALYKLAKEYSIELFYRVMVA